MAHSIIDPNQFEAFTGLTIDSDLESRYHTVAEIAVAELEQLLGWPLDPASWDNQYIEIGKSRTEWFCPDADADLDDPDPVVGSYRLFTAHKGDVYLSIDPALEIHAVKIVRNGVACKTYEADEFIKKQSNGAVSVIKNLQLSQPVSLCGCDEFDDNLQIAVDADWAYEEAAIPVDLKMVLADIILDHLDIKRDVKSESVVSHSYTKYDRKEIVDKHRTTLQRYAGPNGTVKRRLT